MAHGRLLTTDLPSSRSRGTAPTDFGSKRRDKYLISGNTLTEPDLVCDAEITREPKALHPFRRGLQIPCFSQLARSRRIETKLSDKQ